MRANLLIPERRDFDRADALELLLGGLVRLNLGIMDRIELPPLYESGVVYGKDRAQWRHALAVLRAGCADCKSLAAYRAAELLRAGHDARVIVHRTGRHSLHARVLVDDQAIDDPSKRLGMGRRPKRTCPA